MDSAARRWKEGVLFYTFSFDLFVEGETVITRLEEKIRIIVSATTGKRLSKRDYKR